MYATCSKFVFLTLIVPYKQQEGMKKFIAHIMRLVGYNRAYTSWSKVGLQEGERNLAWVLWWLRSRAGVTVTLVRACVLFFSTNSKAGNTWAFLLVCQMWIRGELAVVGLESYMQSNTKKWIQIYYNLNVSEIAK